MQTSRVRCFTELDAEEMIARWEKHPEEFPGICRMEREGRVVKRVYDKQICDICGVLTGRDNDVPLFVGEWGPVCQECYDDPGDDGNG